MKWRLNLCYARHTWSASAGEGGRATAQILKLFGPITWALSAVLATAGLIAASTYVDELALSGTDIDFDVATYVVIVAASIGLALLAAAGYLMVLGLAYRLRRWISIWTSFELIGSGVVFAFGLVVVAWTARMFSPEHPVVRLVVGGNLQLTAAGVIVVLVLAPVAQQLRNKFRAILATILVVTSVSMAISVFASLIDDGTDMAEYTRELTSAGSTPEPPTGLLTWFIRPERGLATATDGSQRCLVRVSDRLYFTVTAAPDETVERVRTSPTTFESSPRCR